MKQYIKRYLAVIMAVAMVVSLLPASMAEAAGGTARAAGTTSTINCSKFVRAGAESKQTGTDNAEAYLVGTANNNATGDQTAAAGVLNETYKGGTVNVGSSRVAAMGFELPTNMDPELVLEATVTITVSDGNDTLKAGKESKAAIFQVDSSKYAELATDGATNAPGATFPAKDGYTKDKTVYGDQWISHKNAIQDLKVNFDVTDWVKGSITNGDTYAIYRLQTVIGGYFVYENGTNTAPVLSITTLTEQEVADQTIAELSVPSVLKDQIELPTTGVCGSTIAWVSDNAALKIAEVDGKLMATLADEEVDATVKLTATATKGSATATKDFTVRLISGNQAEIDALVIPNADNIRGNITLPTVGENGSPITWESSNEAVISTKEVANSGYDKTPAGVVTRQDTDINVTLTATFTQGTEQKTKEIPVTVKAKPVIGEKTDYLFAYFVGDGKDPVDNITQERVYFAASRDGLNWGELNNANPVFTSTLGEEGLRDPYIIRSAEGDKFFLIATDLQIAKGGADVWGDAQKKGSQAIMVWESDDLVNWGEQRMVTVSEGIDAGCTWAPEAFYDERTGEYVVFWASKVKGKNYDKQRLYYCKTRDFYTFTKPKMWIEKDFSVIDTTVVRDDNGTYYRFTKNENGDGKYIFMEKSDALLKGWTSVPSTSLEQEKWVEGPCSFRVNDDDVAAFGGKWAVMLDDFGGVGYYPLVTDDFASANFSKLTTATLPKVKKPRHGTVLNVTAEEYDRLLAKYEVTPILSAESVPDYVSVGYQLPAKAKINYAGEMIEADMTWSGDNPLNTPGKVTVSGTIGGTNNATLDGKTVTKDVEVIDASEDTIYYIDSCVGEWNADKKESATYKAVGKLASLRNTIPDQMYQEGGWGYVDTAADGDGDNLGTHTSTSDDIYANGWYAKSGKNCEYIIPLENGTYKVTGYFAEWWASSTAQRPIKFYVEYTKDGSTVKGGETLISLTNSDTKKSGSINFTVEGIAEGEKAEVHFLAVKNTNSDPDPAISGLCVEKTLSQDEKDKVAAAKEALDNVSLTSAAEVALEIGGTASISLAYPEGYEEAVAAANLTSGVTYAANNPRATEVDKTGKITGLANGVSTVTTTVTVGGKSKAFQTIVTVSGKPVEEVTLNKTSLNIKTIGATATLTAAVTPVDAADRAITWTSDNEAVATVSNGIVTAKSEGKTVITAATANGIKATCDVIVGIIPDVESVTLNESELTLKVGETDTLQATVLPANANQSVTWKSSASSIASVDETGKVTALKEGTAVITVRAQDSKTATCTVTVPSETSGEVPVENVTLNKAELTLEVGASETLEATVTPDNASKEVSWESSEPETVSVDNNGKVTAIKEGAAVITVTAEGNKTATCKVTVEPKGTGQKPVDSITLNKTVLTLKVDQSETLEATVSPDNAAKVEWKSEDPTTATVDENGKVTAKKQGVTKVMATAGGKSAVCSVTVNPKDAANPGTPAPTPTPKPDKPTQPVKVKVNKVKLNKTTLGLGMKEKFTLKVTITPKNATDKKVKWTLSKKGIVTISSKGVVTAKKKGTVKVTATVGGKKATCTIRVGKAPSKLKLNKAKITLKKGKTFKIKAKFPANTYSHNLRYSTNRKSVATVTDKGVVKARKKGKAVITVKTFNGKKAKLSVTVK